MGGGVLPGGLAGGGSHRAGRRGRAMRLSERNLRAGVRICLPPPAPSLARRCLSFRFPRQPSSFSCRIARNALFCPSVRFVLQSASFQSLAPQICIRLLLLRQFRYNKGSFVPRGFLMVALSAPDTGVVRPFGSSRGALASARVAPRPMCGSFLSFGCFFCAGYCPFCGPVSCWYSVAPVVAWCCCSCGGWASVPVVRAAPRPAASRAVLALLPGGTASLPAPGGFSRSFRYGRVPLAALPVGFRPPVPGAVRAAAAAAGWRFRSACWGVRAESPFPFAA